MNHSTQNRIPHMNSGRTNRRRRGQGLLAVMALPLALVTVQACTDLEEQPFSAITPSNFYRNDEETRAGLAAVYNSLQSVSTGSYHTLNEIASDEQVIPTRGQDWFDNGRWLEVQRHTWQANSPSGLSDIAPIWTGAFAGVARANVLLAALEPLTVANKARIVAEVRVLRAYFYYQLLDAFGGVPIVTDTKIEQRPRNTNVEVFNFIESELKAARPDLQARNEQAAADYGRVTKGVADALLASLYLNAQFFTGTVSAGGLQKGTARWQDAIDASDRIIAGPYALAANWQAAFLPNNHTGAGQAENVFISARRPETGVGLNMISNTMHVNQIAPAPNNGRALEPPTYRKFDPDDKRRAAILVGPQFRLDVPTTPVNDRTGIRLNFTIDIRDITQASEGEGARSYKWPIDPARSTSNHGNDFSLFRLAEAYLIKAEALNELGKTAEAIALVNTIRARAFDPQKPLSTALSQAAARQAIFDERLFELLNEGRRRTDQIRAGTYTAAGFAKEADAPFRILYPIPQNQIDVNPMLVQNPGY
jgi:starch-binding outer membrane protein, SusD/RagB family